MLLQEDQLSINSLRTKLGPVFLLLPESEWSDNLIDLERLEVSDPEVKKGLEINSIKLKEEDDVITHLTHHFSSLFCLKKAVA